VARRSLLSAIGDAEAFVCDTAPLVYRLERAPSRSVLREVDAVFDAVENGRLACIVPAVCAAELLVRPYGLGPPAVSVVDALLRSPGVAVAPPGLGTAHGAARHVARRTIPRLADALVAATAAELRLPLVTGDRRLARAAGALLVHDFG
jgi:predicted nucleic acid-binding protein